jgi:hypothetical protein
MNQYTALMRKDQWANSKEKRRNGLGKAGGKIFMFSQKM